MTANHTDPAAVAAIPETLSSKSLDVLIELLAHKTQLLIAATVAKIPDRGYIQSLNAEVEALQAEINRRRQD